MLSTTLPLLPIIFMPLVNNSHNASFFVPRPQKSRAEVRTVVGRQHTGRDKLMASFFSLK